MMKYPLPLEKLISFLRKIPGVGKKSAERYAFQIISWQDKDLVGFGQLLTSLKKELLVCPTCGALHEEGTCSFCHSSHRDREKLCIVSTPKDLFTIESTRVFNGLYHVLHGLLSPLDDLGPAELAFDRLSHRIKTLAPKEVILALDSTLEGDATALFLKRELEKMEIHVSRLAMGMPLGSSLDFLDEGTLAKAFAARSI